jgi:excisionase family DNA binding protein
VLTFTTGVEYIPSSSAGRSRKLHDETKRDNAERVRRTMETNSSAQQVTDVRPAAARAAEAMGAWLDVREAARHLNVGSGSIYTAVASGRLRHVRVGNRRHGILRFKREWLDRYFESLAREIPER